MNELNFLVFWNLSKYCVLCTYFGRKTQTILKYTAVNDKFEIARNLIFLPNMYSVFNCRKTLGTKYLTKKREKRSGFLYLTGLCDSRQRWFSRWKMVAQFAMVISMETDTYDISNVIIKIINKLLCEWHNVSV